jgi:hypothetical protein
MTFLVDRVLRLTPGLDVFVGRLNESNPFDYRDVVDVSSLAKRIAEGDSAGESVATWTRAIRRWVSESAAPEPDSIRRTLDALRFDWVVGLGRCGYALHAIAMLHVQWTRGSRTAVAMQARSIFTGSEYRRNVAGNDAIRDLALEVFRPNAQHLDRLHAAAASCWGDRNGDLRVPTRCVLPRDFPASGHLYAAWILLDSAILNRHGSIEQRLRAVDESVAREIDWWIEEISSGKAQTIPIKKRLT